MTNRFFAVILLLFLVGCNSATNTPSLPTSPAPTDVFSPVLDISGYADLEITMERTICFGTCPAYTLKIFGNGTGVYEGKGSVKVEGIQNFTLTRGQLDELVKAFETANYFSFKDYYSVAATDLPSTMTSITFQGHAKAVEHYGYCLDYEHIDIPEDSPQTAAPQTLCDLEDEIDKIVNIKQWTGN